MTANYVCKERDRGIADYADCIDDDMAVIDDDETVCDDDRDGLTPEEAEAYNLECKILKEFRAQLIGILGYEKFREWCKSYY